MTTNYWIRVKPNTSYGVRQWPQSNLWELADTLGNLIQTTTGDDILIFGSFYASTTPYSVRIKP